MKNILKQNNGTALAMIIIVSTCGIILLTSLLNLAFHNYKMIKTTNKKSNAYYVADFGMEKTIKKIETIVESAKIYANEKIRDDNFDLLIADPDFGTKFKEKFEGYYKDYLKNKLINAETRDKTGTLTFINDLEGYVELPKAGYKAELSGIDSIDSPDYKITVTVTGNNNGEYQRQIVAELGLNPWGYDKNGNPITSPEFKLVNDAIYSSPQWTCAIASSGDIVVKNGDVTVNGDIYVNGKNPVDNTGLGLDGTKYGGLIVGKDGEKGKLTVKGNIFSNNFVHIMAPNSNIFVEPRQGKELNYDTNVAKIYNNLDYAEYSEKASNLNSNGSNPLNIASSVWSSLGKKQVPYKDGSIYNSKYIDYLKNTYKIQKENGGFVYANSIQIEKNAPDSNINIRGSAVVFDNLELDEKGKIKVSNNFYGFKNGLKRFNESSSIITNHAEGIIEFNKRIYNFGVAYVTAFNDANEPYQTRETISIYKNYYAYRVPLPGESTETRYYAPFNFLTFGDDIYRKIKHIFDYNSIYNSGATIKEGGLAYDKNLIRLNGKREDVNSPIYDMNNFNINVDMGFAEGILMGINSNGNEFLGNIKNESEGVTKRAVGSLTRNAFEYYIAHKYSILMETKALKADNGQIVTINNLLDRSKVTYPILFKSIDLNIIVAQGDITVTDGGSGKIRVRASGIDEIFGANFKGLIVSTDGKITINTSSNITIEGAIISGTNPDNVGIEFLGTGTKTIIYNKNILLNIFKLPFPETMKVKGLLVSKRGIVEMFKEIYEKDSIEGFKTAVDNFDLQTSRYVKEMNPKWPDGTAEYIKKIEAIAYEYEITGSGNQDLDDVISLGWNIIYIPPDGAMDKNYKILTWSSLN